VDNDNKYISHRNCGDKNLHNYEYLKNSPVFNQDVYDKLYPKKRRNRRIILCICVVLALVATGVLGFYLLR